MDFSTVTFERVEAKFRAVVDAAPNGMIIVDRSGTNVLANAQTEKLFGYGKGELIGQRIEVLVPERFAWLRPSTAFRRSVGHRCAMERIAITACSTFG